MGAMDKVRSELFSQKLLLLTAWRYFRWALEKLPALHNVVIWPEKRWQKESADCSAFLQPSDTQEERPRELEAVLGVVGNYQTMGKHLRNPFRRYRDQSPLGWHGEWGVPHRSPALCHHEQQEISNSKKMEMTLALCEKTRQKCSQKENWS